MIFQRKLCDNFNNKHDVGFFSSFESEAGQSSVEQSAESIRKGGRERESKKSKLLNNSTNEKSNK